MEYIPYGLKTKKKNKKPKSQINDNNSNINEVNKIIINIALLIRSLMKENNYFPKTSYFIENKNEEKFPENVIFEKLFPNFTSFFKNIDYNLSKAIENKTYITDENNDMTKIVRKYIMDQSHE